MINKIARMSLNTGIYKQKAVFKPPQFKKIDFKKSKPYKSIV